MTKDEMKNRISLALKDPILQQGFEIICKNLTDLEKENAELKVENAFCEKACEGATMMYEQLTKAKEIIKDITSSYGSTEVSEAQLYLKIKKAEQFLNSEVEK